MVLLRFIRSSMFDRWRAKVSTPPRCARNASVHAPCELENVGRVSSSERQRPPRYRNRIWKKDQEFKQAQAAARGLTTFKGARRAWLQPTKRTPATVSENRRSLHYATLRSR